MAVNIARLAERRQELLDLLTINHRNAQLALDLYGFRNGKDRGTTLSSRGAILATTFDRFHRPSCRPAKVFRYLTYAPKFGVPERNLGMIIGGDQVQSVPKRRWNESRRDDDERTRSCTDWSACPKHGAAGPRRR